MDPNSAEIDFYAEVPYESSAIAETHPHHLAALGRLFGLQTAPPNGCRVLELGCGSGGNLIPMAWNLPDSEFVGIELSRSSATKAQRTIANLDLGNIEVRQGNILSLGTELGSFDYIIAHGVYSWVPQDVREALLALARLALKPEGIAYVSYNTLPGWRIRNMLRDMLLHHTRRVASASQQVAAARELVALLEPLAEKSQDPYTRALREDLKRLRATSDGYLCHEYLEPTNHPLLFTEFVDAARRHELTYVCDTSLHTMFPSGLSAQAQAVLDPIDDFYEQEQYLDFITNRTFRQSLLCRAEREPERELDLERLDALAVYAQLTPAQKLNLRRVHAENFVSPQGQRRAVSHPLTKAALGILESSFPNALAFEDLVIRSQVGVEQAGGARFGADVETLRYELFDLFAHGMIGLSVAPFELSEPDLRCPRASRLARTECDTGCVTSVWHRDLQLDTLSARLLTLLDGSRTIDVLSDNLVTEFETGRLSVPGGRGTGRVPTPAQVRANVECLLTLFARQGVLGSARAHEPGNAS
jgi:methyltransferase-like protein/ubiquinone/menaquinone biosynthesis C-methylase UbiE